MLGNAPALTPFERVHQSIAGIPGVPSDPRLHYRKMLNEAWMGHSRKLPQGWETFPQIPVTHPEAHLPHPFGTESYPKIHMESLRDYSIRCNHPASYQEKLRVAVESQLEWIKRYPKIQGDTLSPEQIQNGCGKVSIERHSAVRPGSWEKRGKRRSATRETKKSLRESRYSFCILIILSGERASSRQDERNGTS